jgi:hypothetical protein
MVGLILLLTIATALGAGIMTGYYLLCGILHLMGHRAEAAPSPQLVTREAHGGD